MKFLHLSLFKSAAVLLIAVFLSAGDLAAQTPQFYNYNNGTSYNSFPLNVGPGKMVQSLIAAGEFTQPTPATAGNITKFYLRISTGYPLGPATYTNFKILFSQAAITVLPSGSFYSGAWDTVYQRASVTLTAAASTWLEIVLDHPYPYNPAQGLIVQIEQCGATGTITGYAVQQTSTPGIGRRSYSSGSCPYVYGGLTTSVINCGIDVSTVQVPVGIWSEQTSGLATVLYSVSAVSDTVAWVCGAAGKVLRTTSMGITWTNVSGTIPTTYALYNIFAWDANTAIVTGVAGTNTAIYQTSNGGTTWTAANTHAGFGDDLYMTSATDAYFIGDPIAGNWDLLKSTNAGLNWGSWTTLPTTNTSGTYNNAAWFQGSQVWFPSVGQSKMLYSSNMGTNWTEQTITLSEIAATCFANSTVGLAGGSSTSPGLLKTTDAGITWAAITSPFATGSISGIVGVQNSWWLSQQGLTIAYSTNAGANWTTQYTASAGNFYHMSKSRRGATIWAVRSNGGISRYGNPLVGINPVTSETPADYSLSQNYPNPFNPVSNIEYSVAKNSFIKITIYDMLGRKVSELVNKYQTAGSYSVVINASQLTSGVYYYRMEAGNFTDSKRFVVLK